MSQISLLGQCSKSDSILSVCDVV